MSAPTLPAGAPAVRPDLDLHQSALTQPTESAQPLAHAVVCAKEPAGSLCYLCAVALRARIVTLHGRARWVLLQMWPNASPAPGRACSVVAHWCGTAAARHCERMARRKPCSGDSVVDELVARLDSLAIECCDRLADFVAMLLVNNFFKIQARLAFALRAGSVDRSAMQTLCAH